MFDWFFYIVAAVLAAPAVAVIALVRSIQLNKRLRGVELKLAMLERQSAPAVSSPPQAVARPPAAPPEAASTTVPEAPISPVPPAPSPRRARRPRAQSRVFLKQMSRRLPTRSVSKSALARAGSCGSVASHSRSAAYSWCVIQFNRVSSDQVFGFCWEVCLRSC
jgi:hypothetical protein